MFLSSYCLWLSFTGPGDCGSSAPILSRVSKNFPRTDIADSHMTYKLYDPAKWYFGLVVFFICKSVRWKTICLIQPGSWLLNYDLKLLTEIQRLLNDTNRLTWLHYLAQTCVQIVCHRNHGKEQKHWARNRRKNVMCTVYYAHAISSILYLYFIGNPSEFMNTLRAWYYPVPQKTDNSHFIG